MCMCNNKLTPKKVVLHKPFLILSAMVSALDDAVGSIVQTLKDKNMYSNSIIVFTTDNGGPANGFDGNAASNFPLR